MAGVNPTAPAQLLVEGQDESRLLDHLRRELPNQELLEVYPYQGRDNLGRFLAAFRRASGFAGVKTLGILRDADDSPRRAFQSVQSVLANNGLAVPAELEVLVPGTPKVGVMLLPGEGMPGMLEDLCLKAATHRSVLRCVEEFEQCLQALTEPPRPLAKLRLHAYLAGCPTPGLPLSHAIAASYIQLDVHELDPLRDFVKLLLEEASG